MGFQTQEMGWYNLTVTHRTVLRLSAMMLLDHHVGINSCATKPVYPVSTMAFIIAGRTILDFLQFRFVRVPQLYDSVRSIDDYL